MASRFVNSNKRVHAPFTIDDRKTGPDHGHNALAGRAGYIIAEAGRTPAAALARIVSRDEPAVFRIPSGRGRSIPPGMNHMDQSVSSSSKAGTSKSSMSPSSSRLRLSPGMSSTSMVKSISVKSGSASSRSISGMAA